MGASVKEIIAGRKTFFVTPDVSLFPSNFCEEYLNQGYECYFIENEKHISLAKKIELIISFFHDVVIFFNIDANIPEISWPDFIRDIHQRHNGAVPIGVLYTKRKTPEEKSKIERQYLYDIGVTCGCIQLEYQKKINYGIIERVLFANQAMGRRKNVRAICNNGCTYDFTLGHNHFTGPLQDISLSHFSIVVPEDKTIPQYEKINDIQFNIKGLHFRANGIFFMQRKTEDGDNLLVFMLLSKEEGSRGLDLMTKQLLMPKLYQIMYDNLTDLLNTLYKTYLEKTPTEQEMALIENLQSIDKISEL